MERKLVITESGNGFFKFFVGRKETVTMHWSDKNFGEEFAKAMKAAEVGQVRG